MDATGLRVTAPSGQVTLPADRNHVVGRGRDCDVVIADGRVSRRHVLLEPRGTDGWIVRDMSSNGIWSNGSRTKNITLTDGEVRVHLGAADGPVVVLAYTRPAPRPGADPDVADQETMLAGQGGQPSPPPVPAGRRARGGPPADGPVPPAHRPDAPGPVPAQGGPAGGPELVGAGAAGQASGPAKPAPSAAAVWLRALPTFVWLAAVGFALGALIALS